MHVGFLFHFLKKIMFHVCTHCLVREQHCNIQGSANFRGLGGGVEFVYCFGKCQGASFSFKCKQDRLSPLSLFCITASSFMSLLSFRNALQ